MGKGAERKNRETALLFRFPFLVSLFRRCPRCFERCGTLCPFEDTERIADAGGSTTKAKSSGYEASTWTKFGERSPDEANKQTKTSTLDVNGRGLFFTDANCMTDTLVERGCRELRRERGLPPRRRKWEGALCGSASRKGRNRTSPTPCSRLLKGGVAWKTGADAVLGKSKWLQPRRFSEGNAKEERVMTELAHCPKSKAASKRNRNRDKAGQTCSTKVHVRTVTHHTHINYTYRAIKQLQWWSGSSEGYETWRGEGRPCL